MEFPTLSEYYSQERTIATNRIVFKRNELKISPAMEAAILRCREVYSEGFRFVTLENEHEH